MRKLEEVVEIHGIGIPDVKAICLKRKGQVALYERSDGCFEVFIVQKKPEQLIYNKLYPAREIYPHNEDFGKKAWCFKNIEFAERKFQKLTKAKAVYSTKKSIISQKL